MRLRILELPYPVPDDATAYAIPFVFVLDRVSPGEAPLIREALSEEARELTGARACLVFPSEVEIPSVD